MRTEEEMYSLILTTAREDRRIRAVYMNGSRVNPHAKKDIFQDYDVVYVVEKTEPFRQDKSFIDRFGERLFMQYPDENDKFPSDVENCYGWLIQFADGNRLDLHVQTLSYSLKDMEEDRLCRVLMDKDGCLPQNLIPTDEDYRVKKPSAGDFSFTCNEFWWCLDNVAKGLWREEIPYVHDMLNACVRPQLCELLSWKAGILTDFTCSVGKSAKYLYRYLPEEEWEQFLDTYAGRNVEEIWRSVFTMCQLFDKTAREVAGRFGFFYDEKEAQGSLGFLEHVHALDKDAEEIY